MGTSSEMVLCYKSFSEIVQAGIDKEKNFVYGGVRPSFSEMILPNKFNTNSFWITKIPKGNVHKIYKPKENQVFYNPHFKV
ncbi:hypothetical protein AB834_03125 [PVC group bacterium (ex Bugula neritina AB1)]|nr:hypothetical protein AB834_03125 [PVC group bacterium (ex Bugula neritina AB1)]